MSINRIGHSLGGPLPASHDQPAGLGSGTRMPHAGPVAGLAARAPLRAGDGAAAPRAALGKLTQGLGQKLENARIQAHVVNLVQSGTLKLHGNYPADLLAKVVGGAATRMADLRREIPGL